MRDLEARALQRLDRGRRSLRAARAKPGFRAKLKYIREKLHPIYM